MYSNVLCCSEDRCNKPDAALDPTTKVMTLAKHVQRLTQWCCAASALKPSSVKDRKASNMADSSPIVCQHLVMFCVLQAMESPDMISTTTAMLTQPAPAVEKAAAVEAEELPTATAISDGSHPAEIVQMDPNAGGLPRDGMTTPDSSSVTFNGLAIAPVYSYKKEASAAATQSTAKSVSSASMKSVGVLAMVVVFLLALVL
jgi:hypothetical protein